MTNSEILEAAIALVKLAIDGDQRDQSSQIISYDLLPDLAMAILDRELLREFGRLTLQTMVQRDLAMLLAQRAIKVSSIKQGGPH
jgi:predicted flavoprotein YhiN